MKKIVVAPDKFKGTMSAARVADIIATALTGDGRVIIPVPLADGGEGTAECVGQLRGMEAVNFAAGNSMMEPIDNGVTVWFNHESGEAAVDTSTVLSLQLLSGKPDIMKASSWSFGKLLRDIVEWLHPTKIYIGVGGTSTGDAGAGMLQALGCRMIDSNGIEMIMPVTPVSLRRIAKVDRRTIISLPELIILSDVDVPLVADANEPSSLSFAPQKGATPHDIDILAANLRHWEMIVQDADSPLPHRFTGAGGGLGGALLSLPGAHGVSGAEWMIEQTGILDCGAALIITGEGSIDSQTAMGKIPGLIGREGLRRHIPVLAIGGRVMPDAPRNLFTAVYSTIDYPGDTPEERLGSLLRSIAQDGPAGV